MVPRQIVIGIFQLDLKILHQANDYKPYHRESCCSNLLCLVSLRPDIQKVNFSDLTMAYPSASTSTAFLRWPRGGSC